MDCQGRALQARLTFGTAGNVAITCNGTVPRFDSGRIDLQGMPPVYVATTCPPACPEQNYEF